MLELEKQVVSLDLNQILESFIDENEANARAKMLIHLLENGLIENDI
jgi:hypothetical protein